MQNSQCQIDCGLRFIFQQDSDAYHKIKWGVEFLQNKIVKDLDN